ncbi:hypothetical protein [Halobacteriovorax sp. HLS]|uniref:hypothetical protein n=1 Tax=Halobacteriovorax sp. HLS TaxID=2234000 RepID=UPI000FDB85B4|nr:hypothetical protein [Halobacteriovorax sp. HLS]
MKMTRLGTLLVLLVITSSCTQLLTNRSFIDEMEHETDSFWVAGRDFEQTAGDTGRAHRTREEVMKRTPLDGATKEEVEQMSSVQKELSRKVNGLSDEQYTQYQSVIDYLNSDSEKIYYLNLSAYERESYVQSKMFSVYKENIRRPASHEFGYKTAVAPTVLVGMKKEDVMRSWGRPAQVDVAGDPKYENERWSFYDNGEVKQVYFENGKVSGWVLD